VRENVGDRFDCVPLGVERDSGYRIEYCRESTTKQNHQLCYGANQLQLLEWHVHTQITTELAAGLQKFPRGEKMYSYSHTSRAPGQKYEINVFKQSKAREPRGYRISAIPHCQAPRRWGAPFKFKQTSHSGGENSNLIFHPTVGQVLIK
jgi:hypothetical protein